MVNAFEGIMTGPLATHWPGIRQRHSPKYNGGLSPISTQRRLCSWSTTTHIQGRPSPIRVADLELWGSTKLRSRREQTRGTRHTQPGRTCPRQRPEKTWHFNPNFEYLTRNCWACQRSWKNWGFLISLTGIWGHERRSSANSTRDLGTTLSDV